VAQWVATGLVAGMSQRSSLTTAVVSVSAAARLSDYLQLLYAFCREKIEGVPCLSPNECMAVAAGMTAP
jgi:hypothetical protein